MREIKKKQPRDHQDNLNIEGFVIYTTFFAITTFTIVEVEQEVSENMNDTTPLMQMTFLFFDVAINLFAVLTVFMQGYEVYNVIGLSRTMFDAYRKIRPPLIEVNVTIAIGLNICVQVLRVIRRTIESTPDENDTFYSLWVWFFILQIPFVFMILVYETMIVDSNIRKVNGVEAPSSCLEWFRSHFRS